MPVTISLSGLSDRNCSWYLTYSRGVIAHGSIEAAGAWFIVASFPLAVLTPSAKTNSHNTGDTKSAPSDVRSISAARISSCRKIDSFISPLTVPVGATILSGLRRQPPTDRSSHNHTQSSRGHPPPLLYLFHSLTRMHTPLRTHTAYWILSSHPDYWIPIGFSHSLTHTLLSSASTNSFSSRDAHWIWREEARVIGHWRCRASRPDLGRLVVFFRLGKPQIIITPSSDRRNNRQSNQAATEESDPSPRSEWEKICKKTSPHEFSQSNANETQTQRNEYKTKSINNNSTLLIQGGDS